MGNEQLEHRDHNIDWDQRNYAIGSFLVAYCEDCDQELGTLNITVILDKMEKDE